MGRLLAIDYGRKRCGVAVTDPERLIATPLATVGSGELVPWVLSYCARERVDVVVVGAPRRLDGSPSETMRQVAPLLAELRRKVPEGVTIDTCDERFTTTLAQQALLQGGASRSQRNNKSGLVDRVAASLILQTYLERSKTI